MRYIGKADDPTSRLKHHIGAARRGAVKHATAKWVLDVLAQGLQPVLEVLFEVPAGERWQDAEKRTIAAFAAAGSQLTNSTSGGQGLSLLRDEDRRAVAASLSAAWNRPGAREQRCHALRAANAKPESRARRAAAAADPDAKARHAAGLQAGLFGNPELMARRQESQKAAANRPDVKAAKAAATKARWADPAFRARVRENLKSAWIQRKERQTT